MLTNDVPKKASNFFINPNTTLEECINEKYTYRSTTNLERIRKTARDLFRKASQYYDKRGLV